MSNEQNNGGPAFPFVDSASPLEHPGMSLRDYFAIKSLPAIYADAMKEAREGSGLFSDPGWRVGLALDSYKMADAMLEARK